MAAAAVEAAAATATGVAAEAAAAETEVDAVGAAAEVAVADSANPNPLLAVDTPSMLFRAFYALPKSIVGPDGNPVNALLGSANLIVREVEAHAPRAVVLCFGPDAASYRTELF